ncbi:MAG: hypothetical protein KGJ80_17690 [Chloroflexota bacterium]|nr:hypothetical protein [Chloroflexota bacterium]
MTTDNPNVTTEPKMLTRRQLITTAAAGGAALVVTGLGGAAVGSTLTTAQYELELTKLRALVALYEQLERVGLDAILATGMNIVRGALDAVKGGVNLLRDGVAAAETALRNFQALLDTLRGAATGVGQVLDDLSNKFHAAEGIVVAVLGTALPLAESIAGFFKTLLDKIPFGIGDDIRRAVSALTDLIRAIPTTIDTLTNQLLKPLRDAFFPVSGDPAVKANLIDPIARNVLEPLKKMLTDIETMLGHWENDLTTPVQAALADRQKIREQIAAYKKQYGRG